MDKPNERKNQIERFDSGEGVGSAADLNDASEEFRSGDFSCQMPENLDMGRSRFPTLKQERNLKAKEPFKTSRPQTSSHVTGHSGIDFALRLPTLAPRTSKFCLGYNRTRSNWRHDELNFDYAHQYPTNLMTRRLERNAYNPEPPQCHNLTRFDGRDQFEGVPEEIRWKVRNEGIITHNFGSEITVARLRNDNIVEISICHVIFIMNVATAQYWVKAFTKSTRSQEGCVMKFSRLITRNITPEVLGNTSFAFSPVLGRVHVPPYEMEKHLFNFFDKNMAAKFSTALKEARQQVWNHSALRFQALSGNDVSLHNQSHNKLPSSGPHLDPSIRFRADGVRLFIKVIVGTNVKTTADALLGNGNVYIQANDTGYDHLLFCGEKKELVFDHYIYPWNKPSSVKQVSESDWECNWMAAANHLITKNPRNVPMARDFKMLGNKEIILGFNEALKRSTLQALACRLATPDYDGKVKQMDGYMNKDSNSNSN